MKLRFEKNSVRFRIRKTELAQLKREGFVLETITFQTSVFTYELRIEKVAEVMAEFVKNTVSIHIPIDTANKFIDTEEIGIYKHLRVNNHQTLDIIIEKDFPCKDGPEEDRNDKFLELAQKEGRDEVC